MNDKSALAGDTHGAKDSAADWLLTLPGVHGVAVGNRAVGGTATDEPAILVFTSRKQALRDLAPSARIPASIDGVPTDVVDMSPVTCYGLPVPPDGKPLDEYGVEDAPIGAATYDRNQPRPLLGGAMVSGNKASEYRGFGTIGCFLTPSGATQIGYALTCHHVFFFQAASTADHEMTFQPEDDDTTCCAKDNSIGRLVDARVDDILDIALIALKSGMQWQPEVWDIGPIRGVFTGIPLDRNATEPSEAPRPHLPVKKHGIATGTTGGEVYATGFVGDVQRRNPNTGERTLFRSNAKGFLVQPRPMAGDLRHEVTFATEGDSGAAVLTVADNLLVGILFGGAVQKIGEKKPRLWGVGYVVPVQPILERYNGSVQGVPALVLATSDKSGDVRTVPGQARTALGDEALIDRRQAAQLERQVRATGAGNSLAELYWRHAREVKNLVARNRRVATVWHRSGIAKVVRQFLRAYLEPAERLADSVEGKPVAAIVHEFARVLARYGSAALAADLPRFAGPVADMGGLRFSDMLERLGSMPAHPDQAG